MNVSHVSPMCLSLFFPGEDSRGGDSFPLFYKPGPQISLEKAKRGVAEEEMCCRSMQTTVGTRG